MSADGGRIGHMIEVAMADENCVSPLDVRCFEPERRIYAASVIIGVK